MLNKTVVLVYINTKETNFDKHKNEENLSIYLLTCKLIVTLKKVVRKQN